MNELLRLDPSFNEQMFITKVNNVFIMLYSAIMMDDLDRVRHFISSDLEEKYEKILKELNEKNQRQMYDELNVKITTIKNIEILDDSVIINVDIISRYMDYLVDKSTNQYIRGINDHRIQKTNHLKFRKKIGSNYKDIAQKCPGCGANINVNATGKCTYCGTIFDAENYDWILISIIED